MFLLKDILIPNFIQNAIYNFDLEKNEEYIKLETIFSDIKSTTKYKKVYKEDLFSLFLNIFELDKINNDNNFETLIKKLLIHVDDFDDYIYETDIDKSTFKISTDIENWIKSYLENYKIIVDKYPIFYLIYPRIWKILRYIACENNLYNNKFKISLESAIDEYVELHNEIIYLINYIESMKKELLDIFYSPSKLKIKISPMEIAVIYQAFKHEQNEKLIFNNLNPFIRNINNHLYNNWEEILNKLPKKLNEPINFPICDSITKFLRKNTELLLNNENSIRDCKNCKRHFIVKYSSLAEYCSRTVENISEQNFLHKKARLFA